MPSDAIAGPPSGRTTVVNRRVSLAPSSRAASRSSRGISAKKLRSRKIANGRPKPTWNTTTPMMVPKIPRSPKSSDIGIRAICTGTTSSATTARNHQSRPLKSIQAKAYPAMAPMTMTRTVAGTVIQIVLSRESVISSLPSRVE